MMSKSSDDIPFILIVLSIAFFLALVFIYINKEHDRQMQNDIFITEYIDTTSEFKE